MLAENDIPVTKGTRDPNTQMHTVRLYFIIILKKMQFWYELIDMKFFTCVDTNSNINICTWYKSTNDNDNNKITAKLLFVSKQLKELNYDNRCVLARLIEHTSSLIHSNIHMEYFELLWLSLGGTICGETAWMSTDSVQVWSQPGVWMTASSLLDGKFLLVNGTIKDWAALSTPLVHVGQNAKLADPECCISLENIATTICFLISTDVVYTCQHINFHYNHSREIAYNIFTRNVYDHRGILPMTPIPRINLLQYYQSWLVLSIVFVVVLLSNWILMTFRKTTVLTNDIQL